MVVKDLEVETMMSSVIRDQTQGALELILVPPEEISSTQELLRPFLPQPWHKGGKGGAITIVSLGNSVVSLCQDELESRPVVRGDDGETKQTEKQETKGSRRIYKGLVVHSNQLTAELRNLLQVERGLEIRPCCADAFSQVQQKKTMKQKRSAQGPGHLHRSSPIASGKNIKAEVPDKMGEGGGDLFPERRTPRAEELVRRTFEKALLDHRQEQLRRVSPSPNATCGGTQQDQQNCRFTYIELFAGIGGFRQGLNALGGICVFSNELNPECCEAYRANYYKRKSNMVNGKISEDEEEEEKEEDLLEGDIRQVDIARQIPNDFDLLVGGFPCQPFSAAGDQPGLEDAEKGQLFQEIVKILEAKRPRGFLLENVPGLRDCGEGDGGKTFELVKAAFELQGAYRVSAEVVNARNLTAQNRNRLYFVGIRQETRQQDHDDQDFEFPWIPDLGIHFADVEQTEDELSPSALELLTVSPDQFARLNRVKQHDKQAQQPSEKNKNSQLNRVFSRLLLWGRGPTTTSSSHKTGQSCPQENHKKKADTLTSHYGRNVARGNSMLVPREMPHNPRKLSARECARLMGFPDGGFGAYVDKEDYIFKVEDTNNAGVLVQQTDEKQEMNQREIALFAHYRMLGNAVCPPVICAIAGALLARIFPNTTSTCATRTPQNRRGEQDADETSIFSGSCASWEDVGRCRAIELAVSAVSSQQRGQVLARLAMGAGCKSGGDDIRNCNSSSVPHAHDQQLDQVIS